MGLIKSSQRHLQQAQKSYFYHFYFGVKWGFFLMYVGVLSCIHGVIPALFPFHAPRSLLRLTDMIRKNELTEENKKNEGL